MSQARRFLLISLLLLLLPSCSTSYHLKWNRLAKSPPADAGAIEGAWEGSWKSDVSGDSGKLRCIISPPLNPEGDRKFRYWATWHQVLSGTFTAKHRVLQTGKSSYSFIGSHQLPDWAGGSFDYNGSIINGQFHSTFRYAKDHGTFDMRRPQ